MHGLSKIILMGVAFFLASQVYSCGDILIKATDGTLLNVRSMEFGVPMDTQIAVYPRGTNVQSSAPNNAKGLSWTSKYGYVALKVFGIELLADGLNEKGLSVGALWLPTTVYQDVPEGKNENALLLTDFCSWVLGNFATIEEVRSALPSVYLWGEVVKRMGMVPPVHFSFHDADGKSLVLEFRDGQQKVYDNPIGVLTNYPTFPWQVDNLRNYIKLSPFNAQPLKYGGSTLSFYGNGTGLLGMPGDFMPASRFVRLAYLKNFIMPAKNAKELLNAGEHLFNAQDIALGFIRDENHNMDYTQFVVFKDLTNKVFYYRTYGNMTLRAINLNALGFNEGTKYRSLLMESSSTIIDVTKDLMEKNSAARMP